MASGTFSDDQILLDGDTLDETDRKTNKTDDESQQENQAERKQVPNDHNRGETDPQTNRISDKEQEEVREKAKQALNNHNHELLYSLLKGTQFDDGEDLIELWDAAHYREEEMRLGHKLTPLSRFRIRQKYPPPLTICPSGKRKSAALPAYSTQVLKEWLLANRSSPYPNKLEKIALSQKSKLTLSQVKTWFANARRRIKKPKKGRDVHATPRKGKAHYTYHRPIAPQPDPTYNWIPQENYWGDALAQSNNSTATNLYGSMTNLSGFIDHVSTQPVHSTPLPPFSTFSQKRSEAFNPPPPVLQHVKDVSMWPPNLVSNPCTWMEPMKPPIINPDFKRAPSVVSQRSAFRVVDGGRCDYNGIYRPQPIKMLLTPSEAHQSLHMTHMMCCHGNMNNSCSVFDAGTAQLDVAITLANMGEQ